MSQIHEALRKVKASQLGGKELPKPKIRPRPDKRLERPVASISESEIGKQAERLVLDSEILRQNRVIVSSDALGTNTAYKMLRTRVLQRMRANNWKCLAVSSARPGAGKTLTAINMAISLSFEPNQRVILVDLDLRRPTVSRYLGIERTHGLSNYLHNNVPLEKVIVNTNIDRLMILPNFHAYEHSSELLSSPKMVELVETLSDPSNSTIVIFDLPPLLDADDVLAFSPLFDALLMVVSQGETRRLDLPKSLELLHDIVVLGVVMNKSRGKDDAPAYY